MLVAPNPQAIVRPYEPRDRESVRRLCCDTADRGQPVESFYDDREVFADLLTRYYTDYEPGASWVAESSGRVVGYLTGCLNSRRYQRIVFYRIAPAAIIRAIGRGALSSGQSWRWIKAALRTLQSGDLRWRSQGSDYPAHLHINIEEGFRGQQIGQRLVERFLDQARAARSRGIYAAIRSDNVRSRAFFERFGFTELSRYQIFIPNGASERASETVVYGKQL